MLKLRLVLAGILFSAVLIVVPSLMIFKTVSVLNKQEVVLWVAELIACVMLSLQLAKKHFKYNLFGFVFLFLYTALALLCAYLHAGVISWRIVQSIGAVFSIVGLVGLIMPVKICSGRKVKQLYIASTGCLFTGVSLVYNVWLPLLAAPGLLVLAAICYPEDTTATE
jgi:hypothetical protein